MARVRSMMLWAIALWIHLASVASASSWSFKDAQIIVSRKGSDASSLTEKISATAPLPVAIRLSPTDTMRVSLTTTNGNKPSRPHQAYLNLQYNGLEESFPIAVKDSGKGTLELSHRDIPTQLVAAGRPLTASLILGSFGSSAPFKSEAFSIQLEADQKQASAAPMRYGKLEEIHHIFRVGPKSPPVIVTALFAAIIFATLPVLLGVWLTIGGNFNHFGDAFQNAPVSYVLFTGSIFAMEGIFVMYYLHWRLFQALPAMTIAGAVAFWSGSRALSEVAARRLEGKR